MRDTFIKKYVDVARVNIFHALYCTQLINQLSGKQ